ncbi:TPA: hypothetical protein ACXJFH_001363 [Enterobacter kobei]
MSTITKERLIKIQQWRETYGPGSNVMLPAEEAEELACIALASLESEAVAFRSKLKPPSAIGSERWDYTDHRQPDGFELENCVIERLFTAPPAPVVPNGWVLVPVDMPHEMMRAVQVNSELGAYAATNLYGAYSLFREFWDVAVTAAPQQEMNT